MTTRGFLGIDCGTQGLSVIFTDEELNVRAVGEGSYDMVPGLADECYEQLPNDWIAALGSAMADLRAKHSDPMEIIAIGISGQMHGEVLADESGNSLGPARLWCDSRNEDEGHELTNRFGTKMPKRATATRWLWTIRNRSEIAKATRHMTTPAGWIAYQLTGEWTLGIGDAAGMFPIDQTTLNYNTEMLSSFDELVGDANVQSLASLLPTVRKAGEDAGTLIASGAELLDLPAGIPVAPAEGDQPAALAGSLIGEAGFVSCSFGTSVCANSVGDRQFKGVSEAVDHFCAPDGKPINMVCLRNGTTFMNSVVEMFGDMLDGDRGGAFAALMPRLLEADADCGGLMALPFMDDEPGLGVSRGGTAMVIGLNADNARPGNFVKAALLSTMFNLRLGTQDLDSQGYPRTELVLTGGLTKTPELAQLLADVFNAPVSMPASAEEGTAWGAALMAKFRANQLQQQAGDWAAFLKSQSTGEQKRFEPVADNVARYDAVFDKYRKLVGTQSRLDEVLSGTENQDA